MPPDVDRLIDRLSEDLRPVAPIRHGFGMAQAVLAMGLGVALVTTVLQVRADFVSLQPSPLPLVAAGLFLVLALAGAWSVVGMANPAVGLRRTGWGWAAAMAAVLPAGAALLLGLGALHGRWDGLNADGASCLGVGLATGLVTAVVLTVRLRKGAPASPVLASWLVGLAAGAAGVFAMSFCCPANELVHIGVWHAGAVVVSAGVARICLPRILTW